VNQPLIGPGVGLPPPQFLYPTSAIPSPANASVANYQYDAGSNRIALNAGQEVPIPAGDWYISLGFYLVLEFLDPVTGVWAVGSTGGQRSGQVFIKSDGFNCRIANRTGCPIGATILASGSGYTQASTSIVVTGAPAGVGGTALSTWVPIVGGSLSISTTTIVTASAGAGYGIAPIAIIPPPAAAANNPNGVGGLPAHGYFTIASGTISGFTFTNIGAGYSGTTFNVIGLPNPTDPNIATGITLGTVTFTVSAATGPVTGVLLTNPGAPYQAGSVSNITLTVSGAGSSASINPIMCQVLTTASIVGTSTLNNASGTFAYITTGGGFPNAGSITNPESLLIAGEPRPAWAQVALTGAALGPGTLAATTATIYDGGFFYGTPIPILLASGTTAGTGTIIGSSTIVLTTGPKPDVAVIQQAP
jgi:hypothetical protein